MHWPRKVRLQFRRPLRASSYSVASLCGHYIDFNHTDLHQLLLFLVHPRVRGFGDAVDGGGQRDLLHLAADVEAEARDDDCGDVDPACAGLYGLEDELEERRDERRVPGDEAVDETADERAHRDAEHAYEAE